MTDKNVAPAEPEKEVVLPERNFVFPPETKIRELYTYETKNVETDPKKWRQVSVTVYRNNPDGSRDEVFSYLRNYSMMQTFEPFRQLKDGVWKDYALISTHYTRFEVVDLEAGEIIAAEPVPQVTQEYLDNIPAKYREPGGWAADWKVGDERPGWGFCPVEFKVLDFQDKFTFATVNKPGYSKEGEPAKYLYSDEELNSYTGQWALYSGCLWGDDNGWKLRYIDLSRISEGVVTSDERFGYVPLSASLDEVMVSWVSGKHVVYLPVQVIADVSTGKIEPVPMNWGSDDDDLWG